MLDFDGFWFYIPMLKPCLVVSNMQTGADLFIYLWIRNDFSHFSPLMSLLLFSCPLAEYCWNFSEILFLSLTGGWYFLLTINWCWASSQTNDIWSHEIETHMGKWNYSYLSLILVSCSSSTRQSFQLPAIRQTKCYQHQRIISRLVGIQTVCLLISHGTG